jgi:hypothetical protein
MMGLLDQVTEDPSQMGLLSMGLRLMSTPGKFGTAFGQSGLGAIEDMQKAKMQAQERKNLAQREALMQMEIQRQKVDAEERAKQLLFEEQFRSKIPSPLSQANAVASQAGPLGTRAAAAAQPPIDPMNSLLYQALQNRQIKPMDYLSSIRKDDTPQVVAPGAALVSGRASGYKPLFTNQKEVDQPAAIKEYTFAVSQGDKRTFAQFMEDQKRAGASQTSVKVENSMGTGIASQVGPMLKDSAAAAASAYQQVTNADNLIKAADTGQVIAGPTATLRLKGAQIGQMLGIGGKDDAEKIVNTRVAIQGLAQQTLSARAQLKGQGQVSDYEGKLIERAASGNIDDMTVPEIRKLAEVNKRLSQQVISSHDQFLSKIKANKDPAVAGLADLFNVGKPSTDNVMRFDASGNLIGP